MGSPDQDRKRVLVISKPIAPPWDDSAKNIVRSQVTRGRRYAYRVLTTRDGEPPAPGVAADPIYPDAGRYSAGPKQNARVMLHGLRPRGAAIYHYFFAPNPLTSLAGRLQRFAARVRTVQTICSAPASFDAMPRLLFADVSIALSEDTRRKLIAAGVPGERIRLVRPGIAPIEPPTDERRRAIRAGHGLPAQGFVVLYPGDLEFSSAAATLARAVPGIARGAGPDAVVVFACRMKREASRLAREALERDLGRAGCRDRVRFVDKTDDMPAFVGAADVVVLPAESLYAKMDAPLVLLEAMSQGVPLVLADTPPLDEILELGVGLGVPPGEPEALAAAVTRLLADGACRETLGRAGERSVREIFSETKMAETVETIYDEVLGK